MMEAKSLPLKYWNKIGHYRLGRWCFAKLICWRVPYFSSISPSFLTYSEASVKVSMRKKRGVTNHLGTIHVIAIANLCELAAGTLMEAGLMASMRWIPKGMNINYIKSSKFIFFNACLNVFSVSVLILANFSGLLIVIIFFLILG